MAACKLVKVPKGQMTAKPKAKVGDAPPGSFEYHVGEDGSCTVFGVNDHGQVDISGVATLAVVSADPSIVAVDRHPISGMTFTEDAIALGDTVVTATATWNDGSVGPFSLDDPVSVQQPPPGPVTGLIIIHGTPTVH